MVVVKTIVEEFGKFQEKEISLIESSMEMIEC